MEIETTISGWLKQTKLEESDTPLVRWCIVIIGVLLVWFWLIEPIQGWRENLKRQAAGNAEKAARLVALSQNAQRWSEAETIAKAALEQSVNRLFLENSNTAAQAKIQALLQEYCAGRGVKIESQKMMPAEPEEGIGQRLAVAMNIKGELADILYLLDDISHADELFLIQRWVVRVDPKEQAFAQLVVAGFRPDQGAGVDES